MIDPTELKPGDELEAVDGTMKGLTPPLTVREVGYAEKIGMHWVLVEREGYTPWLLSPDHPESRKRWSTWRKVEPPVFKGEVELDEYQHDGHHFWVRRAFTAPSCGTRTGRRVKVREVRP